MIMPTALMVGVLMPMVTAFSMYMSVIVTAALSMNMCVIMIVPAAFMMDMVVAFLGLLTVCLVDAPPAPAPLPHLLLLSEHLIHHGLLRLCGHLVARYELHGLLGHIPVHLLPLLLHQLLDVDALIAEPAEVVRDQVQAVAALAPDQDDAHLIGVLRESAPLTVLAHIAREHDHQEARPVSHHTLQVPLLEGVGQVLRGLGGAALVLIGNLLSGENVDSNLGPGSGGLSLGREGTRRVEAPHQIVLPNQSD
jgi:hypothetical protein